VGEISFARGVYVFNKIPSNESAGADALGSIHCKPTGWTYYVLKYKKVKLKVSKHESGERLVRDSRRVAALARPTQLELSWLVYGDSLRDIHIDCSLHHEDTIQSFSLCSVRVALRLNSDPISLMSSRSPVITHSHTRASGEDNAQ
jgi:hypothetical protein